MRQLYQVKWRIVSGRGIGQVELSYFVSSSMAEVEASVGSSVEIPRGEKYQLVSIELLGAVRVIPL